MLRYIMKKCEMCQDKELPLNAGKTRRFCDECKEKRIRASKKQYEIFRAATRKTATKKVHSYDDWIAGLTINQQNRLMDAIKKRRNNPE